MSLADRLRGYPAAEEPKVQARTEFNGSSGYLQTQPMPADQPPDYRALLERFGYDPTKVCIVGHPRVSRWEVPYRPVEGTDERGRPVHGELTTRWLASYRFNLAPIGQTVDDLDALVQRARQRPMGATGPHWAVFQAGDQQLGKRSRDGGIDEIVGRYLESVEAAAAEIAQLRDAHGVEGLQISLPGDCIEGNQSQQGKNLWLTELTITEQVRVLRRLMFETVRALAPLAPKVYLDVVNGNHDEAQRTQNTFPGNGWATEAAIAVDDALKLNAEAFGHVEVRVPEQWSGHMTVPVGDTVVTVAHGHQWRRGRAMDWWSKQALNNQPPGAAQVLQNGHWHEWAVASTAERTHIQSPTFDCGSDWYRERQGGTSRRGGLVYLLRAGEVSRMTVV